MIRQPVTVNPFPVMEQQQNVGVSDSTVEETSEQESDLLVNNLIYSMPKSLSLCTMRTYVRMYPEQASYSVDRSTTVVTNWNTGNNYINAANSFLKFKLTVPAPTGTLTTSNFGSGSAINLINNLTIRSRSGTELVKSLNVNQWSRNHMQYTKSPNWYRSIGSMFGAADTTTIANGSVLVPGVSAPIYCIPLTELDLFFAPHKGLLIPPQAASGLRIELGLENPNKALVILGATAAVTGVVMSQIEWVLDAVSLSDDTQRVLNLESSQTGLEYSYKRVYNVSNQIANGASGGSVQLIKAVAQAEQCFLQMTPAPAASDAAELILDSFRSAVYNFSEIQYRLGSLYLPQQPTRDFQLTALNYGDESYAMTLQSFDKLRHAFQECNVSFYEYGSQTVTGTTPAGSKAVVGVSFEKNQDLAVSGLSINNSRLLEVLFTFGTALGAAQNANLFLTYCSVAKLFIDNSAVAI